LERLTTQSEQVRFVSGTVWRTARELVIHPACVVWEGDGRREALQPGVQRGAEGPGVEASVEGGGGGVGGALAHCLQEGGAGVGEVRGVGWGRADGLVTRRWGELVRAGERVGFARMAVRLRGLAERLEQKAHTLEWDVRGAARGLLEVAVLMRVAHDVVG